MIGLALALLGLAATLDHRPDRGAEIVGSSTVYPFAREVAARLEAEGVSATISPTGTSPGIALFCSGMDPSYPDAAMASRPMKDQERAYCGENGVEHVRETVIGQSGIVVAAASRTGAMALTRREIFLAVAAYTPRSDEECSLQPNPARLWSDIRDGLPRTKIEVFGPPLSSGTRASFVDLALIPGAKAIPCLKRLAKDDKKAFRRVVDTLRVDGGWIDAGENDPAIVMAVKRLRGAYGVFGYSHYATNKSRLQAATIDGVAPTEEAIAGGAYPLARKLFIYSKPHAGGATERFIAEFSAERAAGEDGYLRKLALIPVVD